MLDLRDCEIAFTGRLTTMTRDQAFSLAKVFWGETTKLLRNRQIII